MLSYSQLNNQFLPLFADKVNTTFSNEQVDIHAVTGLIKLFLRQLPDALITQEAFDDFLQEKRSGFYCFLSIITNNLWNKTNFSCFSHEQLNKLFFFSPCLFSYSIPDWWQIASLLYWTVYHLPRWNEDWCCTSPCFFSSTWTPNNTKIFPSTLTTYSFQKGSQQNERLQSKFRPTSFPSCLEFWRDRSGNKTCSFLNYSCWRNILN